MPSLEYLRSDGPEEIDPRSDFGLGSSFARFICAEGEPRIPFDVIERPSLADLRQEVALRVLESRAERRMPMPESCLVLIDGDLELARLAFGQAKVAHYREQRRLRRMRPGFEPEQYEPEEEVQPVAASGRYLNVAQVVQRIMIERKPGIEQGIMRRVVVTMLDAELVGRSGGEERRKITARLRRLRRQTGLPLDVRLLRK